MRTVWEVLIGEVVNEYFSNTVTIRQGQCIASVNGGGRSKVKKQFGPQLRDVPGPNWMLGIAEYAFGLATVPWECSSDCHCWA